jgi:phosphate-selective porin OprO/OprP
MKMLFILVFSIFVISSFGQTTDEMLDLMVANNLITRSQADSLSHAENNKTKRSFFVEAAHQMQLTGYTQLRLQVFEHHAGTDGFDVRRARLDLRGKVSPRFTYRLQTDLATSPKILDAYGQIEIADFLSITFGQFSIPFSIENNTSNNRLEVVDYSQAVEALCARGRDVIGNHNGRDVGIQASGIILKNEAGPILEYRLGVFNGTGINLADTANEAKDFAGRLIVNISKSLSFGISYYNGWGKAIKPSPDYIGRSQERDRFGFDAKYSTDRISLKSEYLQGRDGDITKYGWYVMAGYEIIPEKLQVVIKYDSFDRSISAGDDISTWYSGGINFSFNTWARLQAFYTLKQEGSAAIDNNLFVLQYQIGF